MNAYDNPNVTIAIGTTEKLLSIGKGKMGVVRGTMVQRSKDGTMFTFAGCSPSGASVDLVTAVINLHARLGY